jgi:electron transport complex protein RnfB
MGLKRLGRWIFDKVLQYPSIGRVFASLGGALETPLLDFFQFIDRHLSPGFYQKMWSVFIKFYGTRIVPINQAIAPNNQISPTEEILEIIRRQPAISFGWCYCRRRGGVPMDNPWMWGCIHIGLARSLEKLAKVKPMKSANIEEVEAFVRRADKAGFIHQLVTTPNKNYVYVICTCDPKYCVMLKNLGHLPATNLVESHFIAVQDIQKCINCGTCETRCWFGARRRKNGTLVFDPGHCFGCGVCVPTCPEHAIILERRQPMRLRPSASSESPRERKKKIKSPPTNL